jgi:hypothetical protein
MYIVQTFVIVLAVIINFEVTISMEQNPVWEAYSLSVSQ